MYTPRHRKPTAGTQTDRLNTAKKPGKVKRIARATGRVFLTALISAGVPLLLNAQKQDIAKVFPVKDGDKAALTTNGAGSLPKNTLVLSKPDTTSLAVSTREETPIGGEPENAPATNSSVKMSGEKFADVTVKPETVLIGNYIPIGGKSKYSVEIDVAKEMAQLGVNPSDVVGIVFNVNPDRNKQLSLMFKKGTIIIFIDDAEVLKSKKNGDKLKSLVVAVGCAQGGEILHWKFGGDGSFVMKEKTDQDTTKLTGLIMTNPEQIFSFNCGKGDISQIIVKDNVRIITAGNDLVLIAPDLGYKSTEKYDGKSVSDPVTDPDGKRIFFATPEKLYIELPNGNTTKISWVKLISALKANGNGVETPDGDVAPVALHYIKDSDVLEATSASFKMTNGTEYVLKMNLTTKKVTLVEMPRTTTMVN